MSHALCPGSFDPPTVGHLDIITRASVLFDKVTVGVIRNTTKTAILNAPERVEMLKLCVEKLSNVEVISFDGLLVDCVKQVHADMVVKGLRAVSDFDYELQMAQMNRQLSDVETLFMSTNPGQSFLSSSIVRDLARNLVHIIPGGTMSDIYLDDDQVDSQDDFLPTPVGVEELLLRVRELIDLARSMPMSASVLVNREELLELLDDALDGLPEELRHARWLLKEREEFLEQAQRDAAEIRDRAAQTASRMVEEREIVRQAEATAQHIVGEAESNARQISHEAEDYIDQKLASFEVVLDRTLQTIQKGRDRLSVQIDPTREEIAAEDDDSKNPFFDQDI